MGTIEVPRSGLKTQQIMRGLGTSASSTAAHAGKVVVSAFELFRCFHLAAAAAASIQEPDPGYLIAVFFLLGASRTYDTN